MPPPQAPDHGPAISAIISQGITARDLASLTGKPLHMVEAALGTIAPVRGQQSRTRVYDCWQALAALGAGGEGPDEQAIEEAIKRMKPTQLPAALSHEFWKGLGARAAYLTERGDLWRTSKVQQLVAGIYKAVRQSMSLLEDNVDQQTALTPRQREIIRSVADATLGEAKELIGEQFKTWESIDDHDDDGVQ